MKLQQLKFLVAIVKNNLNISAAARTLYTSQPGVSKQIKMLEEELSVELFVRNGKHLIRLTPAGELIYQHAISVLTGINNIKTLADSLVDENKGTLTIATTHTQARYLLPKVVEAFRKRYPEVDLHLYQGTPRHISEMAVSGEVDLAIATEAVDSYKELIMMPCYHWNRSLVVPRKHPLASRDKPDLETLAKYPLVTYVRGLTGRGYMDEAFAEQSLTPDIVFTATDADVIKTYVRLGLGIGIIASMAYEERGDSDLVRIDLSHLFKTSTTKIAFRRGNYLRRYTYDFIQNFSAQLTREMIEKAVLTQDHDELTALFGELKIPYH